VHVEAVVGGVELQQGLFAGLLDGGRLIRRPHACIERKVDQDVGGLVGAEMAQAAYGYADAEYQIKIKAQASITADVPLHALDEIYDDIIYSVKKKITVSNGMLPLSGNAYVQYDGFEKGNYKSGDIFTPSFITIKLKVKYQFEE